MANSKYPGHVIRRVQYVREEFQIVDTRGNTIAYVDPERGKGDIIKHSVVGKEVLTVLEPPRLMTEAEAALNGLPFEGEKPPTSTAVRLTDEERFGAATGN